MKNFMVAVALVANPGSIQIAVGQDYPVRPITMIVPHTAAGGTDIVARIVADRMKVTLGSPIVVENIPAAAGTVGARRLARTAPYGSTLGVGDQTSFVISSAVNPVQYDVLKDFEPISLLSTSPAVLVARSALRAQNLRELIAWLRVNPDKATIGTFGQGSGPHIISTAFQNQTGTRLVSVPYRGVGPALHDLVSGQVDLAFAEMAGMLPHLRSGAIKAYAVLARSRSTAAPDIPAIDEAGGPALHITTWRGMWVPKGTPDAIRSKLLAAVVSALSDPDVRMRVAEVGQEIVPQIQQTPDALHFHHRAEMEKWWPMVKAAATGPN
jgi:tripartite-type tricarboxylate transporter receptor subunit TctC